MGRPEVTTPVRPMLTIAPPARVSVAPWLITLIIAALAASAGYWLFQEHEITREALVEAEAEVARARRQAAQSDSKVMALEAELSRARGEFSKDVQRQRKAREALAAQLGEVVVEGPRRLAAADVNGGAGPRVRVDVARLFQPGGQALSEDGTLLMQNVAAVLARFPGVEVWVRGHVAVGAGYAEWTRGAARALSVVRFLQQESLEPSRLVAVTHAADAASDGGAWHVELVLGDELPRE